MKPSSTLRGNMRRWRCCELESTRGLGNMKRTPCAALLLVMVACASSSALEPVIPAANGALGRGINLGNALEAPREGAWGVTLKAEYFRAIKSAGFNTVRLPVKWSAHAMAETPYTIDGKFAERVDWAIDQAIAQKLNIIVNVHHYDE